MLQFRKMLVRHVLLDQDIVLHHIQKTNKVVYKKKRKKKGLNYGTNLPVIA
jgi:hypothetical protein